METPEKTELKRKQRRKGQTLAEFAITLPILLILLFGIIEFARIFQAWVTLQNAARTAARYASVGQFNETKYPVQETFLTGVEDTGPIACLTADSPGSVGPAPTNPAVQVYGAGNATNEGLFATWYDGRDCEVGNLEHDELRKDLARILSIYDEARRGAAGLGLGQDEMNLTNYTTASQEQIQNFLYEVWRPRVDNGDGDFDEEPWLRPGWFDVTMCSSRPLLNDGGAVVDPDLPDSRFETLLNDLPYPSCRLNEIPTDGGLAGNEDAHWLDAGGPGNTVSIIITFNHPLITPLTGGIGISLPQYLPLQARRSAVVESFRASEAVQVFAGPPPVIVIPPTFTPTDTQTATSTPTATDTPTLTPLASATPTDTVEPPFTCDLLYAGNLSFANNRVYIELRNDHPDSVELTRVNLGWRTLGLFPNMYFAQMALNGSVHFNGTDRNPPSDTQNGTDGTFISSADRIVYGTNTSQWEGVFVNGPNNLANYMTVNDFSGTEFYFEHVNGLTNAITRCTIRIDLPGPTETPEIIGTQPTNTPTFTPDCASNNISVSFTRFQTFGVVELLINNRRNTPAILSNFNIAWQSAYDRSGRVLTLERVTGGGANPADPNSVRIWQGPDTQPNTVGRSEGSWQDNFTIDANSAAPLYLDFGGTSTDLQSAFGIGSWQLNGTWFELGCGGGGGNNGGGGSQTGRINLSDAPTPAPTNTRGPSSTPRPTSTPSRTFTPAPPTLTFTPGPPTNTPQPTNTARPSDTPTPLPPPTRPGVGGGD
jgi:hypothetical protein